MTIGGKPRKRDFKDKREFLRVAAAWAEANMSEWPWGGPRDEDDGYYFVASQPNAETIAALNDTGQVYDGETQDIFNQILNEDTGSVT
jgi:hypothetical protein